MSPREKLAQRVSFRIVGPEELGGAEEGLEVRLAAIPRYVLNQVFTSLFGLADLVTFHVDPSHLMDLYCTADPTC